MKRKPSSPDSDIYRQILSPQQARQTLLRSAIDCAHLLQKYSDYTSLQEEKKEVLAHLRNVREELSKGVANLHSRNLPHLPPSFEVHVSEKKITPASLPLRSVNELDRLKEELAQIERNLRHL